MTRNELGRIAEQYKHWVTNRSQKRGAPILEAPDVRRDDFLDPSFKRAKANETVAILGAREPGRILVANASTSTSRECLEAPGIS